MSLTELGQAIELTQAESRKRAIAELDPGKRVAFVPIPDDPLGRYLQVRVADDGGGKITEVMTPPAGRLAVNVVSLAHFAAVCRLYAVRAILVSGQRVVGLVDPADRRDLITLSLPYGREMATVLEWGKRVETQQANLVRLLRLELAGAAGTDGARQLLKFAESFAVNSTSTQQATIKRDRESLGRSIDDAVKSDAGDCPDSITLSLLVHSDSSLSVRRDVRVAVDFSPSSQQFFLSPSQADLATAVELQIASAITQLEAAWPADNVTRPQIVGASL